MTTPNRSQRLSADGPGGTHSHAAVRAQQKGTPEVRSLWNHQAWRAVRWS
jgi:hypothetical protein